MSDVERDSEKLEATTPLELNKETLQDLDVETSDADEVRGGLAASLNTEYCKKGADPYSTGKALSA